MDAPNPSLAWAGILVDELRRTGLREAVVCPGSRSTPLALALADHPGLRVFSVVDERSAAFFALGLGLATGRPAAVVSTSGTAGANFLPAVAEAAQSAVPLIVLTADRPWELHGFGAPQTMPQAGLFGGFVREALTLPEPDLRPEVLAHLRATVARAAARARRGPVHLNVPLREPLAPVPVPFAPPEGPGAEGRPDGAPFLRFQPEAAQPHPAAVERLHALTRTHPRGLIVCGPRWRDDGLGPAAAALGRTLGWPVLAETASGARFGVDGPVVAHYDLWLQSEAFAARHRPEAILRLGGGLTSKRLQQWLDVSAPVTALFSEDGALVDPGHLAHEVLEGPVVPWLEALAARGGPGPGPWAEAFREADRRAAAALTGLDTAAPLAEPGLARVLAGALPPEARLMVSSSMPIRDLDAFAPAGPGPGRVLANRGVNGIDGVTSTALGLAAGSGRPTALLTGDLALLHDLGGLLTARREGVPLTVVVVNNRGGGIFSHLPVASRTEHFERLFATPHDLDLRRVAELFGAAYARADAPDALRDALARHLGTFALVEVPVARAEGPAVHQALGRRVAKAVEEGLGG